MDKTATPNKHAPRARIHPNLALASPRACIPPSVHGTSDRAPPPPLWEVWLSIGLLVLGIGATGWVSAKIFRYALLMHGKRPTLPDLLGVIRAS